MQLISDANVLIDMHEGGLLESMFRLSDSFCVPDILYAEELEAHYPNLPALGLVILALSGDGVEHAIILKQHYPGPSMNDLFALELARENGCSLLSGDRRLKVAAEKEGIIVRGTIWLVERLIMEEVLTITGARIAYKKMKALPQMEWVDYRNPL